MVPSLEEHLLCRGGKCSQHLGKKFWKSCLRALQHVGGVGVHGCGGADGITTCVTFPASGSAGKGSRPVDVGPDYKPPLSGRCAVLFRSDSTLLPALSRSLPVTSCSLWHELFPLKKSYHTSFKALLPTAYGIWKKYLHGRLRFSLTADLVLCLVLNGCCRAQV